MPLQHWAFVYTAPGTPADGTTTVVETASCRTVLLGVPDADTGARLVVGLAAAGAQLIELCGGFGPLGTAKVLSALTAAGHSIPVGSVAYGPESIDGIHSIFK